MKFGLILFLVLFAIGSFVFLFGPIIKIKLGLIFHKRLTAKTLYKYAKDFDVFLINNVSLPINDKAIEFDHILFGEKFIYCIKDCSYKVGIEGSAGDLKWFSYNKKGDMEYIENPFQKNNLNLSMLRKYMNLTNEDKFFYSIVSINDGCETKIEKCGDNEVITTRKDLYKIIRAKEKDSSVKKINQERLEKTVKLLYERIEKK